MLFDQFSGVVMSLNLVLCCYQELRIVSRVFIDLYESVVEIGVGVVVFGCFSFMRVISLMFYDKFCVMSCVMLNCLIVYLLVD